MGDETPSTGKRRRSMRRQSASVTSPADKQPDGVNTVTEVLEEGGVVEGSASKRPKPTVSPAASSSAKVASPNPVPLNLPAGGTSGTKVSAPVVVQPVVASSATVAPSGAPAVAAPKAGGAAAAASPKGGDGVFSKFNGYWVLDKQRSQSMDQYLKAMGLPQIARDAADKMGQLLTLEVTDKEFIITRKSQITDETKRLLFGQSTIIKNVDIRVDKFPGGVIKTFSILPGNRGTILDTRSLEGDDMLVDLMLTPPTNIPVMTRRVFRRTLNSQEQLDTV